MVALKAAEIDAFVARPSRPIVLVFGPDAGLVRERVDAIIAASVDDRRDPFALARLDGDELAGDPMRLVEEASTIPLLGGRRAVWVKAGARSIVPAVEALLAAPSDCRVVIEAGDLKKNAPLRAAIEGARNAAAICCYVDTERDLARLVDEEMRAAGLTIAPDARAALVPLLGGDRQASRNELRKLALHAHGRAQVTLDDVLAVVADASALAIDAIVDAALAGRTNELEVQLSKARTAGLAAGSILYAAGRQLAQLHKARLAIEDGTDIGKALFTMHINFRREPLVEAALKAWTAARLVRAIVQLAEVALEARRQAALADSLTQRVLLSLAVSARRKE
jgi:DNA polymerase III subunit delta